VAAETAIPVPIAIIPMVLAYFITEAASTSKKFK